MDNSFVEALKDSSRRYKNFIFLAQEKGWAVEKHRRFTPRHRGLFELCKYDTKVNIMFRSEKVHCNSSGEYPFISSIKKPLFYFEEFDAFVINGYYVDNDMFIYSMKDNTFLFNMSHNASWQVRHKFTIPTNWDLLDKILFTKNPNLLFEDIPEIKNPRLESYKKGLEYLKQHGWSICISEDQTTATTPGLFTIEKHGAQANIYISGNSSISGEIRADYNDDIDVILATSRDTNDVYIANGNERGLKFNSRHINNMAGLDSLLSLIKPVSLRHVTIADGLNADIHIAEDGSVTIKNSDQNITVTGKNILISS